jgi:hypothetical protein
MSTWIEHPDLPGQPVEVPDIAVPHYRASGWQVTEAPPKPPKLPREDKPADTQPAPAKTPPAPGPEAAEDKTETESPKPRRRTSKEGD